MVSKSIPVESRVDRWIAVPIGIVRSERRSINHDPAKGLNQYVSLKGL